MLSASENKKQKGRPPKVKNEENTSIEKEKRTRGRPRKDIHPDNHFYTNNPTPCPTKVRCRREGDYLINPLNGDSY